LDTATPKQGKQKGARQFAMTDLEKERFSFLLQYPTYQEAADRSGCSLEAMKKTVARVLKRAKGAKYLTNYVEDWKRKRKELKHKGKKQSQATDSRVTGEDPI
jgi:hypothetical protein